MNITDDMVWAALDAYLVALRTEPGLTKQQRQCIAWSNPMRAALVAALEKREPVPTPVQPKDGDMLSNSAVAIIREMLMALEPEGIPVAGFIDDRWCRKQLLRLVSGRSLVRVQP